MTRIYFKTLGCKVNRVESDDLAERLVMAGGEYVQDLGHAQAVVVNTCTVTSVADQKTRKELRRAARLPNVSQVIATGCAAVLNKETLEALDPKIKVVLDKEELVKSLVNTRLIPARADAEIHTRIRVPVKAQDGCENFCSFCIVPYARGKAISTSARDLINHISALAETGTKEIVLTGINLGAYYDNDATDLAVLLRRIHTETAIHRVRLSSIEPQQVGNDLIELLAAGTLLCEHLHIPLQSGSDAVLSAMNRHYTVADYRALVTRIREAAPQTALTTDIIVGYPTETDEDFLATLALANELHFARTHIFRFSPRVGTPAAKLTPLNSSMVSKRAHILQKQAETDALRYQQSCVGRCVEALVETFNQNTNTVTATTREYLRLTLPAKQHQPGDLVVMPCP